MIGSCTYSTILALTSSSSSPPDSLARSRGPLFDREFVGNRTPYEPREGWRSLCTAGKLKDPRCNSRGYLLLGELDVRQIFSCVGF